MQPPQSSSTSPDRGGDDSANSVYFTARCNQMLTDVLAKARQGRLNPTWRTELVSAPTSAHYGDLDGLAVREIIEMSPELWEPGKASNWRAALDSWFSASRAVLAAGFTDTMRQHSSLLAGSERTLSVVLGAALPADFDNPDRASIAWGFIGGNHVHRLDDTRSKAISNYVQARDWLTAGYLAGLAAGGLEAPDWRRWLRTQAAGWQGGELAVRRVEIETTSGAPHYFDQLPGYWNPGVNSHHK